MAEKPIEKEDMALYGWDMVTVGACEGFLTPLIQQPCYNGFLPNGVNTSEQHAHDVPISSIQHLNYVDETYLGSSVGSESSSNDQQHDETVDNGSPLRCLCCYEGCNKSFSRPSELRRHKKIIHSASTDVVWHCGCCLNSNRKFTAGRKDGVVQHLKKSHGLCKLTKDLLLCSSCFSREKSTLQISPKKDRAKLLFGYPSCLRKHQELEHCSSVVYKSPGTRDEPSFQRLLHG